MGDCIRGFSSEISGDQAGLCSVDNFAYQGEAHDSNAVLQTGNYQGHQISRCESNSLVDLQQVSSDVVFTSQDISNLEEHWNAPAGTNMVMLNGHSRGEGNICISMGQKQRIDDLLEYVSDSSVCSQMFAEDASTKCDAIHDALRDRYAAAFPGHQPPKSIWEGIGDYATEIILGIASLIGVGITFYRVHVAGHRHSIRHAEERIMAEERARRNVQEELRQEDEAARGPNDDDLPPTAGSGTTVDGSEAAVSVEAPAETADAAQFAALDPETTAIVDGYPMSVPPELAGVTYTGAQFEAAASGTFVTETAAVNPTLDLLGNAQAYLQYYQGQGLTSESGVTGLTSVPGVPTVLEPGMTPLVVTTPMVDVALPALRMPTINFTPVLRPAPVVVRPLAL